MSLWWVTVPSPGAAVAATLHKGFLAIRKAGHLCVETLAEPYTDYSGREKVMEVRTDTVTPGELSPWGGHSYSGVTMDVGYSSTPPQVCASSWWISGWKPGAPCERPSSWWSAKGGSWQVGWAPGGGGSSHR